MTYLVIKSLPIFKQLIGGYSSLEEAKRIAQLVSSREEGKYTIVEQVKTKEVFK